MKKIKEKYGLLLIGVLIGIIYGVVTRVVFGERATLASITYLFLIPTILGIIPMIFANDDQLRSYRNIIFIPWVTTATFFLTTLLVGLEEFLCLLVLAAPFFILGTIGAFIVRLVMLHRQKNKFMAIIFLPFLLSPFEEAIKSPSEIYTVSDEIVINASREDVWKNIINVADINKDEFTPGFFNYIGIPRPLNAVVDKQEVGGTRIGNFDGGLKFVEKLTVFEPNERVSFSIDVDPASVSSRVFDQHVLNGNYFSFIDATYDVIDDGGEQTRLRLTSRYRLTSKVNFYGKWWGEQILGDFQERLLSVMKKRAEARNQIAAK